MSEFDYTDYEFKPTFDHLHAYLDGMIDIAEDMFIQIENREQIDFGRSCLGWIDELTNLKEIASKLRERMEAIRDGGLCLSTASSFQAIYSTDLRTISVEVTEGMLRQSLLPLTKARKANLVKIGERFTIKVPGGEEFTTDLVDPGNKLRERGRIRAFYEAQSVKAGDTVVLKEVQRGVWEIEVKKAENLFKNF